jgi:prepilin-type processing-associated H-X9-DG protein
VVITILLILGGMFFPLYSSVREQAYKTECASNLRQVVMAWLLYTENHEGRCCEAYRWEGLDEINWYCRRNSAHTDYTQGHLSPYLKPNSLFGCTSFKRIQRARNYLGYGYNTTYIGGGQFEGPNSTYQAPISIAQLENPTQVVAFAETAYWEELRDERRRLKGEIAPIDYLRSPDEEQLFRGRRKSANLYPCGTVHFRHNGSANVAFADGHLRAVKDSNYKKLSYRTTRKDLSLGALRPEQANYNIR